MNNNQQLVSIPVGRRRWPTNMSLTFAQQLADYKDKLFMLKNIKSTVIYFEG